jgi:hypothetical protein
MGVDVTPGSWPLIFNTVIDRYSDRMSKPPEQEAEGSGISEAMVAGLNALTRPGVIQ